MRTRSMLQLIQGNFKVLAGLLLVAGLMATATTQASHSKDPDLWLRSMRITPTRVVPGVPFDVTVTLKNRGGVASGPGGRTLHRPLGSATDRTSQFWPSRRRAYRGLAFVSGSPSVAIPTFDSCALA